MTVAPSATWVAYCDGSAVPNPGRMACGVVIFAPDGTREAIARSSTAVGCNNEAELWALAVTLEALRERGAQDVLIHTDNSVLVAQLMPTRGVAVPPIERLAASFEAARAAIAGFARARLQWVPRHRNAEADALARRAQGLAEKPVHKPGSAGRLSKARRKIG
ncbi:ribonuclease HI family protein [Xylophilus sp. GOD-11R]|uniref:ribonuclease HI family protein n=1 Tax=Xylophilus sp. GOD-11R TaxID=3089814 RepID=UPI00298CFE67|nr:ribonuclease HI family protein [Xylophilus sp. GOD-11R]WPB56681.1 ribonuclease HI family protein [Xylophilus sp. GOD-11R]